MDEPLFEEPVPPPPKRKRKYKRHKKLERKVRLHSTDHGALHEKKPPQTGRYAGISPALCCGGCNADGCLISGDICVHPYKGGLQAAHRMRPDVLKRFEEVKNILRHQAAENASAS